MNQTITPEIDFDLNDIQNVKLLIKCPKCNTTTKKSLSDLKSNVDVICRCGIVFHFSTDDLKSIQSSMNSFAKTLKSL